MVNPNILKLLTYNVNGFRDEAKRSAIYNQVMANPCIKYNNIGIVFLQETHLTKKNEYKVNKLFSSYHTTYAHDSYLSGGLLIAIHRGLNADILKVEHGYKNVFDNTLQN